MSKSVAVFKTTLGEIRCELFPEAAPVTVRNFVGLAQGDREWTDPTSRQKAKRPLYNGTRFHRVIPQFMIQGGDPLGTGVGGPGYRFEDEFSSGMKFNLAGRLAMANSGPNTNGSQFFITTDPTPWLDGKHTIFGQVISGQDVVQAISKVAADTQNRPSTPVVIESVTIEQVEG